MTTTPAASLACKCLSSPIPARGNSAHPVWPGVDPAHGRRGASALPYSCPSVRAWLSSPPEWLEVRLPHRRAEAVLPWLGAGERDAIVLAQEVQATLLLMDDLEGREEAKRRAFSVMGTLRVLELAAERGLLDLPTALAKLQTTSFYAPAAIIREMLARDTARKGPS